MKKLLIFVCAILLLQSPLSATAGIFGNIFGNDDKIEELNKKIEELEKINKEQAGTIAILKIDIDNINSKIKDDREEFSELNKDFLTLKFMGLEDLINTVRTKPIISVADDKYTAVTTSSGLFTFMFSSIKKYGSGSEIKANITNLSSVIQDDIDVSIEFLDDNGHVIYTDKENVKSIYGGYSYEMRFRVPALSPEKLNMARINMNVGGMHSFKMQQ